MTGRWQVNGAGPALTAALLPLLAAVRVWAGAENVSPGFLDNTNHSILAAPAGDFSLELARLHPEPSPFHASTNSDHFDGLDAATEMQDLSADLKKLGMEEAEAQRICAAHRAELEKLAAWMASPAGRLMPTFVRAAGLPDEFVDYFEGTVAWANPARTNTAAVRESWQEVLGLPAPLRHYKSTWAAYMLGKSWQPENPARASVYYQRLRELSGRGFADPLGLAAASLGLEAQCDLQLGRTGAALEFYLEQWAAGDRAAAEALRQITQESVKTNNAAALAALAADAKTRSVMAACLISSGQRSSPDEKAGLVAKWLAAVDRAGARDSESVAACALAAYQAGDWDSTQKWIDRAAESPVAEWLQAKLLLCAGKAAPAQALLEKATSAFPAKPGASQLRQLGDDLVVECQSAEIPASKQILGELGAVRLARHDYVGALNDFLCAGAESDAEYVADRVLTVEELKNFVDRIDSECPEMRSQSVRNLLAQRLARLRRAAEARAYYSTTVMPEADALAQALAKAADLALAVQDRAAAFFTAAKITQAKGTDLYGKDANGTNAVDRFSTWRTKDTLLPAAPDELRRAAATAPEADEESHYPFLAAALGWQAAELMPDNSDDTARVLCQAGSWIKYLDPKRADVFYKALVRRCRRTGMGAQADRMRWFPLLDADGNLLPYQP